MMQVLMLEAKAQAMSQETRSMVHGPNRRTSISLNDDFQNDFWGFMADSPTSIRLPDHTLYGRLNAVLQEQNEELAEWTEVNAKLQSARRNRRTYEFSAEDSDDLKVIAAARLKLEKRIRPPQLRASATHMEASSRTPDTDLKKSQELTYVSHLSEQRVVQCECTFWELRLSQCRVKEQQHRTAGR